MKSFVWLVSDKRFLRNDLKSSSPRLKYLRVRVWEVPIDGITTDMHFRYEVLKLIIYYYFLSFNLTLPYSFKVWFQIQITNGNIYNTQNWFKYSQEIAVNIAFAIETTEICLTWTFFKRLIKTHFTTYLWEDDFPRLLFLSAAFPASKLVRFHYHS